MAVSAVPLSAVGLQWALGQGQLGQTPGGVAPEEGRVQQAARGRAVLGLGLVWSMVSSEKVH